jgi:hypothetical protein
MMAEARLPAYLLLRTGGAATSAEQDCHVTQVSLRKDLSRMGNWLDVRTVIWEPYTGVRL